jgi:hypothetical protein
VVDSAISPTGTEVVTMKAFLLVAALGFGTALTPASACDWQKEANYTPVVVAAEQTTGVSTASQPAEPEATVDAVAKTPDEPATSAPAMLASQQ